jgi:predicted small secreted protein
MKGIIVLACIVLAGCDTMAGLGQDMQRAGSNLTSKATESKYNSETPPPPPPPDYPPYRSQY